MSEFSSEEIEVNGYFLILVGHTIDDEVLDESCINAFIEENVLDYTWDIMVLLASEQIVLQQVFAHVGTAVPVQYVKILGVSVNNSAAVCSRALDALSDGDMVRGDRSKAVDYPFF